MERQAAGGRVAASGRFSAVSLSMQRWFHPHLRRVCSLLRSAGGQKQHHPASQPAQRPGTVRLPASEHCKETVAMVVTAGSGAMPQKPALRV